MTKIVTDEKFTFCFGIRRLQILILVVICACLSGSAGSAADAIQWGANVHYAAMSKDELNQLPGKLTERNFTCIRLDVWGQDPNSLARFREVASILKTKNIRVEAILFTSFARDQVREHDTNASPQEVESAAYEQTKHQVEATMDLVQDYELGNEVSLYPGIKAAGTTGEKANDYDVPAGKMQAAALRGMSKAIDDVRKKAHLPIRIILGTTDRSFGLLSYMQKHGVLFDVVGFHHYPWEKHPPLDQDPWFGEGGPLGQLAKFGKPVIINEFNSGEVYSGGRDHVGPNYENEAGKPETELGFRGLDKHLKEIVNQKRAKVEAVLFYELFDEPAKEIPENRFGLYYDPSLTKPKISMLLATAFAGGKLSEAERQELSKRGIGPEQGVKTAATPSLSQGKP